MAVNAVKLGAVWVWDCPGLPIPNVVPHWDSDMAMMGCRLVSLVDRILRGDRATCLPPAFMPDAMHGQLYTESAGLAVWLNSWRLNRTTWESEMVARYITRLTALLVQFGLW